MNADILNDLAARVEAGNVPDARLDCLIENELGLARFERDPRVGYGDADYNRVDPKPFTASIDAAMTLVPEGCLMVMKQVWAEKGAREWYATINAYMNNRWHWSYDALHVSPAITLTAAALRAHAAIAKENEGG